MDPTTIITTIATIINQAVVLGPTIITAVEDAVPFATAIYNNITGKTEVTQADLDALQAQVQALIAEASAPIPPGT